MKNPQFFVTASVICGLIFISGSSYAGRLNSSSANSYERGIQASKMAKTALETGKPRAGGSNPAPGAMVMDDKRTRPPCPSRLFHPAQI